jgi:hypothetical protein
LTLKELGHKSYMKVVRNDIIFLRIVISCRFLPQTKKLLPYNSDNNKDYFKYTMNAKSIDAVLIVIY